MSTEVYCEPFLSLSETLDSAKDEGLRVDEYLEKRWGCCGQARRVIGEIKLNCELPTSSAILEIGPGSGRFLYHTATQFEPARYEIYEPAIDWSRWLAAEYPAVTAHVSDGRSLRATSDSSCDLVVAHGVFVYLKMLCTFEYVIEMSRVCRPGGYLVFDIFIETEFSVERILEWLETTERFPAVVPEPALVALCDRFSLRLVNTFARRLGVGESRYFVFQKA